jgi:hypothetical protein
MSEEQGFFTHYRIAPEMSAWTLFCVEIQKLVRPTCGLHAGKDLLISDGQRLPVWCG